MNTMCDFLKRIKIYKNEEDEGQSRFVQDECRYLIEIEKRSEQKRYLIFIMHGPIHIGCVKSELEDATSLHYVSYAKSRDLGYVMSISD